MPTFQQNIIEHIRAGYQVILVPTTEEARVEKELQAAAEFLTMDYVTWDQLEGYSSSSMGEGKNPTECLTAIKEQQTFSKPNTMVVYKDLHNFYDNPDVRRAIRSMSERVVLNNSKQRRPLILVQPSTRVHPDLSACLTILEFTLPTPEQLNETFENIRRSIKDEKKRECSDELKYHIVQGLRGLTSTEAANCLALCLIRHKGFVSEMVDTVEVIKANMLKRTEILTYVPKDEIPPASELGGYDELIAFVDQRSLAYTPQAAEIGLDMPKGIVIVGVPGTGKSKAAEVIASRLQLPLVVFDFSAVFNALVGESERRTREVINMVTAMGGCVLLIDEADKALGGSHDATGDSGVTRRVFGAILTWLAKKKDRTFVVMTANRTKGMPPELLRKGRFDEIFYVDLPSEEERRSIFEIHMTKRNVDPKIYVEADWKRFLKESTEFVGSEIEESVKSARFAAFQMSTVRKLIDESTKRKTDKVQQELRQYSPEVKAKAFELKDEAVLAMGNGIPSVDQMIQSLQEVAITKVVKVDQASIDEIRKFGNERARSVSSRNRARRGKGSRNIDLDPTEN